MEPINPLDDAFNTIEAIDGKPFYEPLAPLCSAYNLNSTINVVKHKKTSNRIMKKTSNKSVDIKVPTATDDVNVDSRPSRETNKLSLSQKVTD